MYYHKSLIYLTYSIISVFVITGSVSAHHTTQHTVSTREIMYGMDGTSIVQGQYIPIALNTLKQAGCNTTTITNKSNTIVQDTLINMGLTVNKSTAQQYYSMYQQRHTAASTYTNQEQYCIFKNAAYRIQHYFYLIHTDKIAAINPVFNSDTYRSSYFDTLESLNIYTIPTTIKDILNVRVANRSYVLELPDVSKQIAGKMSTIYQGILGQALNTLYNDGILSYDDIKIIGSKVLFNYVQLCSEVRGITRVTMTYLGDTITDQRLTAMVFNVNICHDSNYLKGFDEHIKSLIYHEIAHYIYYFKDPNTAQRHTICSSSSCTSSDYVSEYAQTAAHEDYAETFQYWYQGNTATATPTLQQKYQYFDKIFKNKR